MITTLIVLSALVALVSIDSAEETPEVIPVEIQD